MSHPIFEATYLGSEQVTIRDLNQLFPELPCFYPGKGNSRNGTDLSEYPGEFPGNITPFIRFKLLELLFLIKKKKELESYA